MKTCIILFPPPNCRDHYDLLCLVVWIRYFTSGTILLLLCCGYFSVCQLAFISKQNHIRTISNFALKSLTRLLYDLISVFKDAVTHVQSPFNAKPQQL